MDTLDRYSRQILFSGIGTEGQRRLGCSFVVLVGCGALGCSIANTLVRAGVGRLRIIDRDFIELHNLPRQTLFTEADVSAELPKAVAAERHLRAVNTAVQVEGIVADFDPSNAEQLVESADIILDGLDNFETRFLLNDVAFKRKIPWIYGGAIRAEGMTATFVPGETPCFRCLIQQPPPPRGVPTCETAGVLNTVPQVIASIQSTEAIKLLVGAPERNRGLLVVDLWRNSFELVALRPAGDCPTCQGNYQFLEGERGSKVVRLCGQNSVQIWDPRAGRVSLSELAEQLQPLGSVGLSEQMLRFRAEGKELVLFYDGRAIIRGTDDPAQARAFLAKYLG